MNYEEYYYCFTDLYHFSQQILITYLSLLQYPSNYSLLTQPQQSPFNYTLINSSIKGNNQIFKFSATENNSPVKKVKINGQKQPIVNFAGPVAPLVAQMFYDAGFQISFGNQSTKFNINYGSPKKIPGYRYFTAYQYINQIPGSYAYTRKDILAESLKANKFNDINPESYLLPKDVEELREAMKENPENPNQTKWFIYKPALAARGENIKLISSIDEIEDLQLNAVIQRYIDNPFLYKDKKIDFRIYFAVTSVDPLVVYVYDDFIGRVASKKYKHINKHNAKEVQMHLTNCAVNKNSKDHKLDWETVFGDKETQNTIKQQIHETLIKTLIATYPQLISAQKKVPEQYDLPHHYFSYYGADIMFTDELLGKIIEINASPSLSSESDEDYKLKRHMLASLLNMIGIEAEKDEQNNLYIPKLNLNGKNYTSQIKNQFTYQDVQKRTNKLFTEKLDYKSMKQKNLDYEIRVLQQIFDEETREDKKWFRIFPLSKENQQKYGQFVNITYLNSMVHQAMRTEVNKEEFLNGESIDFKEEL